MVARLRHISVSQWVRKKSHPSIWLTSSGGGSASRLAADGIDSDSPPGCVGPRAARRCTSRRLSRTSQLFRVDLAQGGRRDRWLFRTNPPRRPERQDKSSRLRGQRPDASRRFLYVADLNGGHEMVADAPDPTRGSCSCLLSSASPSRAPMAGTCGFFMKRSAGRPKKYPMILTIHGGPSGRSGFDWYHEFQAHAAHGWAVFFTNPRGSTGTARASSAASS